MSELDLPEGWEPKTLIDLADYINGFPFKPSDWSETGLPIVRIAQITGSSLEYDYFRGSISNLYRLETGDIIFSWSGTLCVVRWHGGQAWLNQHLFRVTPYQGIDVGFFFHLLSNAVENMEKSAHGSTMKHIKRGELKKYNVVIPVSLKEQQKIAQILDTLDTQIRKTEALIAKLEKIKEGLLHDLLTRGIDQNGQLRPSPEKAPELYKKSALGLIPKQWEIRQLVDVASVERGQFTHRPRNDPKFYGGPYPFIQTGDIARSWGKVVTSYSQTLSSKGLAASKRFPAGTIAVTIAANIADSAILGLPMYFPDSVVGIIPSDGVSTRFIELCIRRAKPRLDARAPQSAQKNINLQDLRPLKIPIPSQIEQRLIAKAYEGMAHRITQETQCLSKFKLQKTGLVDDLLTGRVRVTPLLDDTSAA